MSGATAVQQQATSLAAVVDAARLVDRLARTGSAPASEIAVLEESLFRFEWVEVADVFGGVANLRGALEYLEGMLGHYSNTAHGAVLRYVLALLRLGDMLSRDRERLAVIRERLAHIGQKSEGLATSDDEAHARIAAIYQDTISTCSFRIQVSGSATHLQNTQVAQRIRALLLAGLRAAILWRFVGGSRIATLFRRTRLISACRVLRQSG